MFGWWRKFSRGLGFGGFSGTRHPCRIQNVMMDRRRGSLHMSDDKKFLSWWCWSTKQKHNDHEPNFNCNPPHFLNVTLFTKNLTLSKFPKKTEKSEKSEKPTSILAQTPTCIFRGPNPVKKNPKKHGFWSKNALLHHTGGMSRFCKIGKKSLFRVIFRNFRNSPLSQASSCVFLLGFFDFSWKRPFFPPSYTSYYPVAILSAACSNRARERLFQTL